MTIDSKQVEQIRLLMSTYQDGSGQLRVKGNATLPNWRDFERINVDIEKSFYLACLYHQGKGLYQLFALPFLLPDPTSLIWKIREPKLMDENKGTLVAMKDGKLIIEWYGTSGGQLKYYPTKNDVIWQSDEFKLEQIPNMESGYGLIQKAKTYFPEKWI